MLGFFYYAIFLNMKIKPPKEQIEIENAIIFLIDCIKKRCYNEKPLILHSIRVGIRLFKVNRTKETVIAGFLHDLLEDTDCKIEDIEKRFNKKVLDLVLACTAPKTKDSKERWFSYVKQIKEAGEEAVAIKIVDADDNLSYVPLIKDKNYLKKILWKHKVLIEELKSVDEINKWSVFKKYCKSYRKVSRGCL